MLTVMCSEKLALAKYRSSTPNSFGAHHLQLCVILMFLQEVGIQRSMSRKLVKTISLGLASSRWIRTHHAPEDTAEPQTHRKVWVEGGFGPVQRRVQTRLFMAPSSQFINIYSEILCFYLILLFKLGNKFKKNT